MTGLFILDIWVYLWLAVVGSALLGLAIDPTDQGSEEVATAHRVFIKKRVQIIRKALGSAGYLICLALIAEKVANSWGTIALAATFTLVCGTGVALISFAFSRTRNQNQPKPPIAFTGATAAIAAAICVCALIMPTIENLGYEEYSYGTETRALEPLRSDKPDYLAEKHGEGGNYIFKFARQNGDTLESRRYILNKNHVVILDDANEISHAEGETSIHAKIDPISGKPLEIPYGKVFQPYTLYIHKSEIWTGNIEQSSVHSSSAKD